MHKRTFSLDPEVEAFLSLQPNRSKVINEIVKRHIRQLENDQMALAYQAMGQPEAMAEFAEWEQATLQDGLDDE